MSRQRLRLRATRQRSAGGYVRVCYTCPCDTVPRAYAAMREHLAAVHTLSHVQASSRLRTAAQALPPTLETVKRCGICGAPHQHHAVCACCEVPLHPPPPVVPALCQWCQDNMPQRAEVQALRRKES